MKINYGYLDQQFSNPEQIFSDLRELVASGEFTLGPYVERFEKKFAEFMGVKHVIGTNTGTDALILALQAAGIGAGDEVITVANTFYASAGAIVAVGAKPVFVDCDDRYSIDPSKIEAAITAKTRAILPVHWAGFPCEMEAVMKIADRHRFAVIEDACQAIGATVNGRKAGTFGKLGAFSMHPLKPLNVWGDGGMIVTNDDECARWLRLYRNHGMTDRDHIEIWGVNRRLQPFQAVVAYRVLDTVPGSIRRRVEIGRMLDESLQDLEPKVRLPRKLTGHKEVCQLYLLCVERRDELLKYLVAEGVDAKIHYPVPLHLQKPAREMGYREGMFPVAERQAKEIITLPLHQFMTDEQVRYMVQKVRAFYGKA